jgi:hypothetical protein
MIILPFGAVKSELIIRSLNKPHLNNSHHTMEVFVVREGKDSQIPTPDNTLYEWLA